MSNELKAAADLGRKLETALDNISSRVTELSTRFAAFETSSKTQQQTLSSKLSRIGSGKSAASKVVDVDAADVELKTVGGWDDVEWRVEAARSPKSKQ